MGFFELFATVLAWFYSLTPSYGLAIILLTVAVRVLLLPLSIKSTRSMREMQVIQPEVKRLQKKYKNDRQKMNTEVMALYKEHGVNPFGGCLPLLLQMPVFIGLFYVVREPIKYLSENTTLLADLKTHALSVHQFLGIRLDCTPVDAWGGEPGQFEGITQACSESGGLIGALPYLLLIAFMGGTTYYQQRQMTAMRSGQTDPQQQQMQTFMKVMPFILVFFGFSFPAGVILYWVTTNCWTIVQQRIMLRAAPPIAVGAGDKTAKGLKSEKGGGGKKAATSDASPTKSGAAKGKPGQPPKKSPEKKSPTGGANRSQNRKKKK